MIHINADVTKTEQAFPVNLVKFSSSKPFDDVIVDLEKQLGKLDEDQALSNASQLTSSVKAMEGSSGLMIVSILLMDKLLPSLISSSSRVRQYLIGNPLIASQMAQHDKLAALYAPPRVLVYIDEGKTWIAYDQPSTAFGRLASDAILQTARELDEKFELLARTALA